MYMIYADDQLLYAPYLVREGYGVFSPKLTVELGKAGSLEFTMPPNNVLYDGLSKLKTILTVYQNGERLFRGRALHDDKDFFKQKKTYCEGELAFLLDSKQRPYTYEGDAKTVFTKYISAHNTRVGSAKQFTVGKVTAASGSSLYCENSSYSTTLDEIDSQLVKVYGGYLQTRYESGVHYIDWLSEPDTECNQTIQFGVNLLDLSEYITAEDIFTIIIPIGASRQDEEGNDLGKLDITSVNDGKDYIENTTAISLFGRIEKTEEWGDCEDASELKTLGTNLLNNSVEMAVSLSVKAVDLNLLGVDVDRIRVGDMVRVLSVPHSMDKKFQCTKIVYDLENPDQNEYTFGVSLTSLTDQQVAAKKNAQGSLVMTGGFVKSSTFSAYQTEVNNNVDSIRSDLDYVLELMNNAELPVGYTKLAYLESTGTQYIDTGFMPNQDTRVVIDYQYTSSTEEQTAFMSRKSATEDGFGILHNSSGWYAMYGTSKDNLSCTSAITDRISADFNKNNITLNGVTDVFTASTFTCPVNLTLFVRNTNGALSNYASAKLYSCKIYDNGTLVRDYIPAVNPSGVYGLYDKVNGQFYINAGTGSFS